MAGWIIKTFRTNLAYSKVTGVKVFQSVISTVIPNYMYTVNMCDYLMNFGV